MNEVKEYFLASGKTIVDVQAEVNKGISNGFRLYGEITATHVPNVGLIILQSMVK
ncbi:MAG: hypothetical protein K9G49_13530 [Taibaiella sp.]|nr:hypothetical protein [Taibaiella sp.]